jgi:nucleotide-binding universal stress UspA family protein
LATEARTGLDPSAPAEQQRATGTRRAVAGPILVATDLSPGSTRALVAAHQRSVITGAPLIVTHVLAHDGARVAPLFPQHHSFFASNADVAAAERSVRAQMHAATGRSEADYELMLGRGLPSEIIASIAKDVGAALVVVGHGSNSSIVRAFLGSTTKQLTRVSPASLLVVRAPAPGCVVAATDARGARSRAVDVAEVEAEMRNIGVLVVSDGDPVSAATDQHACLIVVDDASTYDHPADIVERAPCSVLVTRGALDTDARGPGRAPSR